MDDPLAIYLHDHLAGSHFAVKLLDSLHDQYRNEELGRFALALVTEIKEDQATLQNIIDFVGRTHLDLAEAAGWIVEKTSRLKLKRDDSGEGLGTFEALETLALGIHGKLALWRALAVVAEFDKRIPNYDFQSLAARAQQQHDRVEEQRLQVARRTFRPGPK